MVVLWLYTVMLWLCCFMLCYGYVLCYGMLWLYYGYVVLYYYVNTLLTLCYVVMVMSCHVMLCYQTAYV